jgi:hypothetical protein
MRYFVHKWWVFSVDNWGVYILPLIGYSWSNSSKRIWIGWLWFLLEIKIGKEK